MTITSTAGADPGPSSYRRPARRVADHAGHGDAGEHGDVIALAERIERGQLAPGVIAAGIVPQQVADGPQAEDLLKRLARLLAQRLDQRIAERGHVASIKAPADIRVHERLCGLCGLYGRFHAVGFPVGVYFQAASVCAGVYIAAGEALTNFYQSDLEAAVASVCDVCGKGPGFGNNVSHSHVRTHRVAGTRTSDRSGHHFRHAQALERVHLLRQGRQGYPLGVYTAKSRHVHGTSRPNLCPEPAAKEQYVPRPAPPPSFSKAYVWLSVLLGAPRGT